jgi:hypothetical protein
MEEKVDAAIENYFKMKTNYEKLYKRAKKRIINSDLSLREKRLRLKKLKPKCLGCKRNVGMHFYTENDGKNLRATCGSEDSPCSFNINIERGEFAYIPTLINSIKIDLENTKTAIVRLKLEILFSLTDEESIGTPFEELKGKYKEYKKILATLHSILDDNMLTSYEDMGEERIISRKEVVEIKKRELEAQIAEINGLIKTYLKEDTVVAARQSSLTEAIENYINNIIPLVEEIRENTYEISTVLREGSVFRLIQKKTKLSNQQLVITPPKIIANMVKIKAKAKAKAKIKVKAKAKIKVKGTPKAIAD